MDFKGNYRLEAVYFEKLKRNINEAKRLLESGATEEARFLLEDSVDVDGSVLLLYRNLGELWADLADKLEETKKALQALDEKTEKYHDELNEKIDEINNYIMSLIRALEERVTELETIVADHETRIENLEETAADHETRIGNLENCCEEVQEALADKQDLLTAGSGIAINNNEIRTTVADIRNNTLINTQMRQYFTREIKLLPANTSNPYSRFHLEDTVSFTANVNTLNELLANYNALKVWFSIGFALSTKLSDYISIGDIIEIEISDIRLPSDMTVIFNTLPVKTTNLILSTTPAVSDPALLLLDVNLLNLHNTLNAIDGASNLTFKIVVDYYVKVNGNYITQNTDPHFNILDPSLYYVTLPSTRGLY